MKRGGLFKSFGHNKAVIIMTAIVLSLAFAGLSYAERIKDVADFEGVRENKLIGYGLVVGLDGGGDKGITTMRSIANMLNKMGLEIGASSLKTKNTAAVIVTATLPPFPKPGIKLNGLVSTISDAKTLQGGTLLLTPMQGPDGKVYALAQGPVSIGGFAGGEGGTKVVKNHPTSGIVPNGVGLEVEPPFTLGDGKNIRLFLRKPDFTTASGVAGAVNRSLGGAFAKTTDPSTISIDVPESYSGKLVDMIALLESIDVSVDMPARVVVNERTGTVVIGDNVTISPVAIAHGSLTIEIATEYSVSQPQSFAPKGAQTTITPSQDINITEQPAHLLQIRGVTLGEVVAGLNALGVTPRDLVAILQALKAAGALRAELEII